MKARPIGILVFAVFVLCSAAAPHFYVARPRIQCALPARNYQYKKFSGSVVALSAGPIPLRSPVPRTPVDVTEATPSAVSGNVRPSGAPAVNLFQFVDKPLLEVEHCRVSGLNVQIDQDGYWAVNGLAEQNATGGSPVRMPQATMSAEQAQLFTDHLLRNQFVLQIRCYGETKGESASNLGRPLIACLDIKPFWVQKGQPLRIACCGCDSIIAENFDLIQRVEAEFCFRRD